MKFNNLYRLVTEMPISKFKKVGDNWDKNISYDKGSFNDLRNPEFEAKVRNAFSKIDYDFNFYFINNPIGAIKDFENFGGERGEVLKDDEFFDKTKLNYGELAEEDAITIIFTGNYGDKLVKLTPWILSHRIGHAIKRINSYSINESFNQLESELARLAELVYEDYGIPQKTYGHFDNLSSQWNDSEMPYQKAVCKVGKFKSARENNVPRPYEFIYELFAQYCIAGGISLNYPLKDFVFDGQKYKFKSSDGYDYNSTAETFNYYFDVLLSESVGKVFVM